MFKKLGFTLAEVLITLGIIGVVAAMTIPTLMQKTNDSEIKSSYKKMMSVLNQAISMNFALDGVDFSTISAGGSSNDSTGTSWLGFIYNRMNVVGQDGNTVYFNDGTSMTVDTTQSNCTEADPCEATIDVNGKKGPNTVGDDSSLYNNGTLRDQYTIKLYKRQASPAADSAGELILRQS